MPRRFRVAIGSIFTECSHLGGQPIDLSWFQRYELRRGAEILEQTTGVVGGWLASLRQADAEIVPTIVASTCPGGPLTRKCYDQLKGELLDGLRRAGNLDGVALALHGAAAVEGIGDLEGDFLTSLREIIGRDIPVVVTLDHHAHVTEAMVRHATAMLAWATYPHVDSFQTGQRGARLLLDILHQKCKPVMAMAKVPVIVGAVNAWTDGPGPFADVMRFAKSKEGAGSVVSTSVFLVHPYLDLPDMGGGGLVITNNDRATAESFASEIAMMYWERRKDLEPELFTPADAIARGMKISGGPVLLVETADCSGGGAAGDSVHTLRALLDARLGADIRAIAPVVDPEAAAQCHAAGIDAEVTLSLGHKLDPKWGSPITITGRVSNLTDGRFLYRGGMWDNQHGHMGPTAVLETAGVRVMITTHATYDYADEQYRSVGLDASTAKFVVVKNPMNFRIGYANISKAALILDTPGPTPAVVNHVKYERLKRPYYPADRDIAGLRPRVYRSAYHDKS